MSSLQVRPVRPDDFDAVAELTVAAYRGDGQTHEGHSYEPVLRDVAGRVQAGEVLVCVDGDVVLGAVLFVLSGSEYAEVSREGEAEFRMLAVVPSAQRRGVGEALVRACLQRATEHGARAVVICARDFVESAHRLYKRLGFVREPSLDWEPIQGVNLLGLRYQL